MHRANARPDAQFAGLLEHFRPYLLVVADRELDSVLRPKGGASDLVQDTLVAAYRDRRRCKDRSPKEIRAWLRAILRFQLANLRRRYREAAARSVGREVPSGQLPRDFEPPAHIASLSEEVQRREELDRLASVFGWLPEPQRQIVTQRVQGRATFAQIGEKLGMSEEAVRTAWRRALRRLRGWMELSDWLARCTANCADGK
jgi:RNA polymerase sigma-70 factor, ECF subfamily